MSLKRTIGRAVHTVAAPFVAALMIVALALWGFAHQPLSARALMGAESVGAVAYENGAPTLELSEYMLPDGTYPLLCLGGLDGDGAPGAEDAGCEACRLASTMAMPEGGTATPVPVSWPFQHVAAPRVVAVVAPPCAFARPRAPPVA